MEEMIPRTLAKDIDTCVGKGMTHVGFVLTNQDGRVFLLRPKGDPYGVTAMFPRVPLGHQELSCNALARCVTEQIGVQAQSVYPLHQIWVTNSSITTMFAGITRTEPGDVPQSPLPGEWLRPEQAKAAIMATPSAPTRQRNLGILNAVSQMCLSPYRRIFLMVRELHRMGFERLRIIPGLSPSGAYWRCSLVPTSCISTGHGAEFAGSAQKKWEEMLKYDFFKYTYFNEQEQEPFGWHDAHFDTPRDLAVKFADRLREVAFSGWGSDADYVHWYDEMLSMTAPNGLFVAYMDYGTPPDNPLPTAMFSGNVRIPMPPPGTAPNE